MRLSILCILSIASLTTAFSPTTSHHHRPTQLSYKDEKNSKTADAVTPTELPKKDASSSPEAKKEEKHHKYVTSETFKPLPIKELSDDEDFHSIEDSIPFDALATRAVDTVEDILLHLRRKPYDLGWVDPDTFSNEDPPTVVVLGSGWAAHAFCKVANTYKIRVIVVSPVNHFVFTPMLSSAAVGTVEYRSITESVREANPMVEYVQGEAVDVDLDKKVLYVQQKSLLHGVRKTDPPLVEVPYDTLISSVGAKVADHFVLGAAEHALKLKTADNARVLRNSINECLEFASRLDVSEKAFAKLTDAEKEERRKERRKRSTFVIVGAGPTGVEVAGELKDFFRDITKDREGAYQNLKDDLNIVLIDGLSGVVTMFRPELSQYALEQLQKQGVDVRLDTFVKEIGDGFIKIFPKGGDKDKDEQTIENGLTIWAAGVGAVPFTEKLLEKLPEEAKGPQGRIKVDKWLRPKTKNPEHFGSILVLGDAAAFENDYGAILPQNAQVAGQHGAYAGRMINRGFCLKMTPPVIPDNDESPCATWARARGLKEAEGFEFLNLGLLAYLGGGESLTQVQVGNVPVYNGMGRIPFLLWRSVYLVKQVATRNRILVSFDWAKAKMFGRDTTRL